MPRVVSIVSYKFLPAKVGGQKSVALFQKYFARRVSLECITTDNNEPDGSEGYKVIPMLSSSRWRYINPLNFSLIKKLLVENNATHLLIEHPYFGWLAYWLKRSLGIHLIVRSQNIEGLRWKSLGKWWWWILWRYEKFTHRNADFNFFIHQQDQDYAIRAFRLDPSKCMVVTYGIERNVPPTGEDRAAARNEIAQLYGIAADEKIFLFNGSFDYKPNRNALNSLLHSINPLLSSNKDFRYKLIICGRDIPAELRNETFPNVIIAGFVEDIADYFKAADVFLNPVVEGGGIKTKLVEALGYNCNAVSTGSGATGVDASVCGGKLIVVKDNDWKLFSEKAIEATRLNNIIGEEYFAQFYWGYSTARAARFLEQKGLAEEAVS